MSDESFEAWAAQPDDQEAFKKWYIKAFPVLFKRLFALTRGDRFAAEDLLQETLVAFIERRDVERMRDATAIINYLTVAARRRWIDHHRRERRELSLEEAPNLQAVAGPPDVLLLVEQLERFEGALSAMDRRTLEHLLENRGPADVAQLEQISYTSAGVRIHRLKKKLRMFLDNT